MKTFNFQIATSHGIDTVRIVMDQEHASISVVGATAGVDRKTMAALLRDAAQVCDDGGEAFERGQRQTAIAQNAARAEAIKLIQ